MSDNDRFKFTAGYGLPNPQGRFSFTGGVGLGQRPAPGNAPMGRQIFANPPAAPATGPAPVALREPSVVVGAAADKRFSEGQSAISAKSPVPRTGNAIEGLGYVANFGIAQPLQARAAADAEAREKQGMIDALISTGLDVDKATAIAGGGVAGQYVAQNLNAKEAAAARLAAQIKLLEKEKELGVGKFKKGSGSAWLDSKGQLYERPVFDENGEPVLDWRTGKQKVERQVMRTNLKEANEATRVGGSNMYADQPPEGWRRVGTAEIEGEKAAARAREKAAAEAKVELPKIYAAAEASERIIDQLLDQDRIEKYIGHLSGRAPLVGTDAKDFEALMKALEGQAFLVAFQSLKGGGAITEIEGTKATQAYLRLIRATSPEQFVNALQDYRSIVENTVSAAEAIAGDPAAQERMKSRYSSKKAYDAAVAWRKAYKKDKIGAYKQLFGEEEPVPAQLKKETKKKPGELPQGFRWVD